MFFFGAFRSVHFVCGAVFWFVGCGLYVFFFLCGVFGTLQNFLVRSGSLLEILRGVLTVNLGRTFQHFLSCIAQCRHFLACHQHACSTHQPQGWTSQTSPPPRELAAGYPLMAQLTSTAAVFVDHGSSAASLNSSMTHQGGTRDKIRYHRS